jgi:hypothetical protein
MEHTIDVGDRVLADRHDHSPRLGDIVIAHPPVGALVLEDRCAAPEHGAPCARNAGTVGRQLHQAYWPLKRAGRL